MNETIWSQPCFRLYETVTRLDNGGMRWDLVPRPSRHEEGQRSLINFSTRDDPTLTLQHCINSTVGLRNLDDGSKEIWIADKPLFIRVLYQPSKNAPTDFQKLRRFNMPVYDCDEAISYVDTGDEPRADVYHKYELGDVVKIGSEYEEGYIRTYQTGGAHITLASRGTSIINDEWRLDGATSGAFLLVYHWTDAPQHWMRFAEVNRLAPVSIEAAYNRALVEGIFRGLAAL